MRSDQFMAQLRSLPPSDSIREEFLQHARILLNFMSVHALDLQLADGHHLTNVIDFRDFLNECYEATKVVAP